jgi:AmiR/NasT family two-component response regulator
MHSEGERPDAVNAEGADGQAPLKVAICLAGEPLPLLQGWLKRAGHQVQQFAAHGLKQLHSLAPLAHVAVIDREVVDGASDGAALGTLAALSSVMPVVLIASSAVPWPASQREGVSAVALLPRPVDGATLLACLPLWVQRHREAVELRARETQLLAALQSSRQISAAVGMLAERHQLSVDAAFQQLRQQARARRQRTEDLAQGILAERDSRA